MKHPSLPILYEHSLDPAKVPDSAAWALGRLHTGEWEGFGSAALNQAIRQLYDRHRSLAVWMPQGIAEPECLEIHKCVVILSNIWALQWLEQGENVLSRQLKRYLRKAYSESFHPHNHILYGALQNVASIHYHGKPSNFTDVCDSPCDNLLKPKT